MPGSLDILRALEKRGVAMYLASGTDERYVREESGLLQLTRYFGSQIYGAREGISRRAKATRG